MKLNKISLTAILFVLMSIVKSCRMRELCNCPNPFYVDKPKNIYQCTSASVFRRQIDKNFKKIFSELASQSKVYSCDLSYYKGQVEDLRSLILKIVDAYYECRDVDCTPAIQKAIDNYVALKVPFGAYTRCALALFSSDCARLVYQVRPLVFSSAENIISAMLTCAELKSGRVRNTGSFIDNIFGPILSAFDCNCVDISTRPAPSNQNDCFSPRFISELRNFITVSYKNIQDNYINSNATCGYAELQSYYHQLEIETNKFVDIIIGPNPTYAAVDQAIVEYRKVVTPYTNAVRDYILANNKPCYFVVRKARNNPIAIGDWTITVAKKCVGYKDSSKLNC